MKRAFVVLFVIIFLAMGSVAGARRVVLSINPLGFLATVTNASIEAAVFRSASLQVEGAFMLWDFGNEELGGWSANASIRFYPDGTAPEGFFIGPGIGTGFGREPERPKVARVVSGFQWVDANGFAASMSASLNLTLGETEGIPLLPLLGVNIGYAF